MLPRYVTIVVLFTITLACFNLSAQTRYSQAYGKKTDPPVIYMHGGPRGNATLFEGTTAQDLADRGFYVIVYDRRGEGRSVDTAALLTFDEAFNDLNALISRYGLKKVNLIGHSFGGIVSALYAATFPQQVDRLILVGALFAQQESYDHILDSCATLAHRMRDTATANKIAEIAALDKNSAAYRKKTYEVASQFRFFTMPSPTTESKKMNERYEMGPFARTNIRNDDAPTLFYKNERRVNIDTKDELLRAKRKGVRLSAIYGLQDGIFSASQLQVMQSIVGARHFYAIDNCSHYPFVDQHESFIQAVVNIMGGK